MFPAFPLSGVWISEPCHSPMYSGLWKYELQTLLISRSSANALFAAAGKRGRVWQPHPHSIHELRIFHCPCAEVPAQQFVQRDGSAKQQSLMRIDQGIETPRSSISFFLTWQMMSDGSALHKEH